MKQRLIGYSFALVILAIAGWWFANRPSTVPVQVAPPAENSVQTIQPPVTAPTPAVAPSATPPPKSKEQEMSEALAVLNHRPIEFYGKLVDQDGNPVAGADVYAGVMVATIWMGGKLHDFQTKTDATGSFSIRDIEGRDISFGFEKPGYEYRTDRRKTALFKYSLLTPAGERHHPDSNAPVVFTIWKLRGPESLVHFRLDRSGVPVNGTPTSFDLVAGKKLASGGDIILKVERQPEHIQRGQRFDWKAVIEVSGGGIAELNDAYPNEAPPDGYEAQFTIEMPANSKDWQSSVTRNFYVKARGGKLYARLTLRITADYEPPPTGVTLEAFVNPSGSRNLEYDPTKQASTR